MAVALHHVGTVHARSGDSDENLALPDLRHRPLLEREDLRPAGLRDRDRPHRRRVPAGHVASSAKANGS